MQLNMISWSQTFGIIARSLCICHSKRHKIGYFSIPISSTIDELVISRSHRRTQDFTTEGVHVVGAGPGVWRRKSPSGVQGQSPCRDLENEVRQKLKQNVKLVYNF